MIGVAATSLLIECKELRAGESDADDDEATSVCLLLGIGSWSTMFFSTERQIELKLLYWQINYIMLMISIRIFLSLNYNLPCLAAG